VAYRTRGRLKTTQSVGRSTVVAFACKDTPSRPTARTPASAVRARLRGKWIEDLTRSRMLRPRDSRDTRFVQPLRQLVRSWTRPDFRTARAFSQAWVSRSIRALPKWPGLGQASLSEDSALSFGSSESASVPGASGNRCLSRRLSCGACQGGRHPASTPFSMHSRRMVQQGLHLSDRWPDADLESL
jgi:hypothetical protein